MTRQVNLIKLLLKILIKTVNFKKKFKHYQEKLIQRRNAVFILLDLIQDNVNFYLIIC